MSNLSTKLIHLITNHFKIADSDQINKLRVEELINLIRLKNNEAGIFLSEFFNSEKYLNLLKKDKEMRIKYPEIWQMQIDQLESSIKLTRENLIKLGEEQGIEIKDFFASEDKCLTDLNNLFTRPKH
ncbi:MAG: hypothetical protein GY834_04325 [Bacteroidetes bacterium]|nr:hypothetical protein [Bacteroidota bacterium]